MLVRDNVNVELEMFGPLYDDPTVDHVLEYAKKLGLGERVTYGGFLEAGPELLAAYNNHDIYVLPTHGEGSVTRTIKEAFATGLPVVATTIREITEFLEDGKHAVLVPMKDPAALAAGLRRVIDDPALRAQIADAGFEWVQDYTNEASAAIIAGHVRDEIARLHQTK
jgi:glycosyltransferase involved in cell wall biosynthesis